MKRQRGHTWKRKAMPSKSLIFAALGEIDIIAREDSMLVFCELRTNTGSDLTAALESMTPSKLQRLRRLALYYLQKVYGGDRPCRFDFLAVLLDPENLQVQAIKHIQM